MKNLWIFFLLLLFISTSCEESPVVFMDAQPNGIDMEKAIDVIYQGSFWCDSDSSVVRIEDRTIYKEKAFSFSITPEEIAESEEVELIGNQILLKEWMEWLPATVTDSMVYSQILLKDTIFSMDDNHVLKNYKGHVILNKKITPNKWEVSILSLDNDLNLRYAIASLPEDLKELEKITPVVDISTEDKEQILLAPTYLEFEEILKQRLIFEECDVFTRVASVLQI